MRESELAIELGAAESPPLARGGDEGADSERLKQEDAKRTLALALPDELIDLIAERAAERLADRVRAREDRWLRGADQIARYLDCPRSRVYALASARRIPIHRDGSALVARCSELDVWIRGGGGRRP